MQLQMIATHDSTMLEPSQSCSLDIVGLNMVLHAELDNVCCPCPIGIMDTPYTKDQSNETCYQGSYL